LKSLMLKYSAERRTLCNDVVKPNRSQVIAVTFGDINAEKVGLAGLFSSPNHHFKEAGPRIRQRGFQIEKFNAVPVIGTSNYFPAQLSALPK
jgi:hypothetical protein